MGSLWGSIICTRFKVLSDTTPYGDRSIRASLSGDVTIRYAALVENNLRQLLPQSGLQHLWSELPSEVLPFLLQAAFVHATSLCDLLTRVLKRRRRRRTGYGDPEVDPSQRRLCRRRERC